MTGMQKTIPAGPRGLLQRSPSESQAKYSICTMVTSWTEYEEFLASFRKHGFGEYDCELLTLDNSDGNRADAYVAVNEFLQAATAPYLIIVHQDVLLIEDDRAKLDQLLKQLTQQDDRWGLCGNAGFTEDGWPVFNLSHPFNESDVRGGPYPAKVVSLDENLIIVRRECNLAASADLGGFHHYGADLCTIADILGWSTYVIDFFLHHKSGGTVDEVYDRSRIAITRKYARALRPRWIHLVTSRPFFIAGRGIEETLARAVRKAGKAIGLVPRYRDIIDPVKQARQSERRQARRRKS